MRTFESLVTIAAILFLLLFVPMDSARFWLYLPLISVLLYIGFRIYNNKGIPEIKNKKYLVSCFIVSCIVFSILLLIATGLVKQVAFTKMKNAQEDRHKYAYPSQEVYQERIDKNRNLFCSRAPGSFDLLLP